MLDANQVVEYLWQGGYPERPSDVRRAGFGALVLCARELQPPKFWYPGVDVFRVPLDDVDTTISPKDQRRILSAATCVSTLMQNKVKVLVTCAAGLNRSGIVSALSLRALGIRPHYAVLAVRAARGVHALNNRRFANYIEELPQHVLENHAQQQMLLEA